MAPPSTTTLLGPPQINLVIHDNNDKNDENTLDRKRLSRYPSLTYSPDSPTYGYTENYSKTYVNSGNSCLDFFFNVVPDTPSSELVRLLELSWNKDPLITLKLVCNLRGVRGTGKSDKQGFYVAALWLHENHPKTLALNMKSISCFGYLKDMPEILFRVLEGSDVRKISERQRREYRSLVARRSLDYSHTYWSDYNNDDCGSGWGVPPPLPWYIGWEIDYDEKKEKIETIEEDNEEDRVRKEKDEDTVRKEEVKEEVKEKARILRLKRKNERTKKALDKYNQDLSYRVLYDSISDLFGELLKNDVDLLNKGDLYNIGLSAKWCPTIDSTYDEVTLLCESIARRVFPKGEFDEYKDMEEAHYAYIIRKRLRKEVLAPLRTALKLPEVYICAKNWNSLPYNRVPSVAMKAYKSLFYKHDKERFEEYLENVKAGKDTIAAGALLPHEIIGQLNDGKGGEVAELQWKKMVSDLATKGKLNNCMAISDVSGSMTGVPMEVSVALGLLISELSVRPWKRKLITFSEDPQFHIIKGQTLLEKTSSIRGMDWGGSTNFQKVFDKILKVAVKAKVPEEQMIKRLFVFSDMEFDEASHPSYNHTTSSEWETDYMIIQRKFNDAGYGNVPEIVFWNLRHSRATPGASNQPGVALVSGFSKNLLTLFLEDGGIVNPEAVMLQAISKPEYDALVVYD